MTEKTENGAELQKSFTRSMLDLFDPERHYTERNLEQIGEMVISYKNAGISAQTIFREGLLKGMESVAEKFKKGEVFLPDIWKASQIVKMGMEILGSDLPESSRGIKGRVLIGTVEGDIHDIGKNLVIIMLEAGGFEVMDLGINVPAEKFLHAAKEVKPHIIGLSAMLTTTMGKMKEVIKLLSGERFEQNRKIIVGGGPITKDFANSINADAYAEDCVEVAEVSQRIREQQIEARMGDILDGMQFGG